MMEPYLQCSEVMVRYETLYFQPRKNPRNICDITSSKPRSSGMLHGKNKSLRYISAPRLTQGRGGE